MPHRQPRTPLTKLLLNILANLGDSAVELGHLATALSTGYGSAYQRGGHGYVVELKQLANERRAREIVRRLQRSHYVQAKRIGQRLMITLTDKGRAATLAQELRTAPAHRPNYFTIVIFDIPESQRTARLRLRTLLKQGGFWLLQHSVWVSDRDARQMVADFVRRLKLERWVNVYHATNLLHQPKP